jgi:hypothetical protein
MGSAYLVLYAAATGFVSAGFLASLYQLVTDRPPGFLVDSEGLAAQLVAVLIGIFAGPFIIMRNALRGRRIERRPLGWLAASACIAAGWSLCSGIVLLDVALRLRDSIA